MFIKVTKCSNDKYWYKDLVGETLELNYMIGNDFRCWNPKNMSTSYLVLNEDCEVVDTPPKIRK
jgi:hypothetical protein